jgi:hypothetical protein
MHKQGDAGKGGGPSHGLDPRSVHLPKNGLRLCRRPSVLAGSTVPRGESAALKVACREESLQNRYRRVWTRCEPARLATLAPGRHARASLNLWMLT